MTKLIIFWIFFKTDFVTQKLHNRVPYSCQCWPRSCHLLFFTLGNLWQFHFNLQYTKTGQEYVHLYRCHMVESDCSVISFLMLFFLSKIETSTVFLLRQVLHTLCLDQLCSKCKLFSSLCTLVAKIRNQ